MWEGLIALTASMREFPTLSALGEVHTLDACKLDTNEYSNLVCMPIN